MALLYLVRLLIDPLEIESHHANRYLHGRPVGDEGRHPGGDTDLQVMRRLVGTVVGGARTGGVLARTISIGQARLIEKAEYLAAYRCAGSRIPRTYAPDNRGCRG